MLKTTVLMEQDKTDGTKKRARKNTARNKLFSASEHPIIGREICYFS